jgi:hypothetical protein
MMKKYSVILIVSVLTASFFCMCEDEEKVITRPSIEFKMGGDYTSASASASLHDSLKVGIIAESGNRGPLVLFEISRNGEIMESIGMKRSSLDADVYIIKDTLLSEAWKFLVRDKVNSADSVSITLTLADTSGI